MKKLFVMPIVIGIFALGAVSTFAMEEQLTPDQRAELRARAERLQENRARAPQAEMQRTTHHVRHSAVHHARKARHAVHRAHRKHHEA